MEPNKPRIKLLVDALRSGEFKQGKGHLEIIETDSDGNETITNCCLGVACRVAMANGHPLKVDRIGFAPWQVTEFGAPTDDPSEAVLPTSVMRWYGLNQANPSLRYNDEWSEASSLNDGDSSWGKAGLSFDEIADAFERTFLADEQTSETG
jgi:hypothetical protein